MQNLWKWLMHANAKAALAIALLVLVAAAVWSALQFAAANGDGSDANQPIPPPAKPPQTKIVTSTGLLPYVQTQAADESLPPVNPFAPSLETENIQQILAERTRIRDEREKEGGLTWGGFGRRKKTDDADAKNAKAAEKDAKAATPPVTVTYKGFFQRPDGTPVALIHDSRSDKENFYTPGRTVGGATIDNVTMDTVTLRLPNGDHTDLASRASYVIPQTQN